MSFSRHLPAVYCTHTSDYTPAAVVGAIGTGYMTFIIGAGNDLLDVGQGTDFVGIPRATASLFA